MADAVTSQTIFDGERMAVMKFTNLSDGTGETAVVKVDVSALSSSAFGKACDGVTIERIHYSIGGMSVSILWDATADVPALILAPGQSTFDFCKIQIPNDAGSGKTGEASLASHLGAVNASDAQPLSPGCNMLKADVTLKNGINRVTVDDTNNLNVVAKIWGYDHDTNLHQSV